MDRSRLIPTSCYPLFQYIDVLGRDLESASRIHPGFLRHQIDPHLELIAPHVDPHYRRALDLEKYKALLKHRGRRVYRPDSSWSARLKNLLALQLLIARVPLGRLRSLPFSVRCFWYFLSPVIALHTDWSVGYFLLRYT